MKDDLGRNQQGNLTINQTNTLDLAKTELDQWFEFDNPYHLVKKKRFLSPVNNSLRIYDKNIDHLSPG